MILSLIAFRSISRSSLASTFSSSAMDAKDHADHVETSHSQHEEQEAEKGQPQGDMTLIPQPTNDPNDPLVSEECLTYSFCIND